MSNKKDETAKPQRGFYERAFNFDRRYLWWGMTILIMFILVHPLNIPIPVNDSTVAFGKFVDNLKPGTAVLISQDNTVTVDLALKEGTVDLMRRLLERQVKMVILSLQMDGISTTLSSLKQIPNVDKYKYGVDYVQFGFYTGAQNVPAALQRDVWGTLGADVRGTAVKDLPIMQNLKQATDFAAWFETGGGGEFAWYINTWSIPYKIPGSCEQTAANLPLMTTWYQNGVLNGFINDQIGSAQLSRVWAYPSGLSGILDAQSVGHILLIALIALGNAFYIKHRFGTKRR